MQLSVFSHFPTTGWSMPPDPALDSERTLVVAFGSSGLVDAPGALDEILGMYPSSRVLGCSTSGEIHGNSIHDDSLTVAVARFDRDHACARPRPEIPRPPRFKTLARALAGGSGCRARRTPPQVGLTRAQRRQNVAGAFAVAQKARIDGASVVLIDDVITTGATAGACARALKRAGAARVDVLALALVTDVAAVTT